MSSETWFPLLRLPLIALSELLNVADPTELMTLSFCSQKMRDLVKLYRNKSIDWEIKFYGMMFPGLSLRIDDSEFDVIGFSKNLSKIGKQTTEYADFDGKLVPITMRNGVLTTVFDKKDYVEGVKTIANYVLNFFDKPIIHRVFVGCKNRWMIDWINERQTERLRHGHISLVLSSTNEEFHEMIESLSPTKSLTINATPSRYSGGFHDIDQIYIRPGQWVTWDALLAMDSISIEVKISHLTSANMNLFIKHWLAGSNPRLKYVNIQPFELDFEKHFDGLTNRVVNVQRVREYRKPNGKFQTIGSGYDIRRDDGVVATINDGLMVVWPDLDGNHN